ncbi:MAG: DUF11 domain-containing protein, partial [Dehalococcoidia bacterium]
MFGPEPHLQHQRQSTAFTENLSIPDPGSDNTSRLDTGVLKGASEPVNRPNETLNDATIETPKSNLGVTDREKPGRLQSTSQLDINLRGKSANRIGFQDLGEADLSLSKEDDVDPVEPGGELVYTVRVDNCGPSEATGVVVTDTLPAGVTLVSTTGCAEDPIGVPNCTLGSIPADGFAQYSIAVTVNPEVTSGSVLTNTATASSDAPDPDTANDADTEETLVTAAAVAEADLSLSKADDVDPVAAGGQLVYTVGVDNAGPSEATGVVVTDNLPSDVTLVSTAGCAEDPVGVPSCTLGSVSAGGFAQYTVTVTVNPEVVPGTVLTNTATVASDVSDPNPANDTATEDTLLPPLITLALVDTEVVGVSRSAIVEASIPSPAPPGGVTVTVTSDDLNILTVTAPG